MPPVLLFRWQAVTAKIIPIGSARSKLPEGERLRFHVERNGDLSIRLIRGDGIVVPAYVVADEHVDALLRRLYQKRAKIVHARVQAVLAQSEAAKRAARKPPRAHRDLCRMRRDGGKKPVDGCRRNAGHAGPCRDAQGDYAPAICSHLGMGRTRITIEATGEAWLTCARCGQRVDSQ